VLKRLALTALCAALLALALVPSAGARILELGTTSEPAKSNCPNNPCEVVGRVTGYQGRSGPAKNPFRVPHTGKIVAFTVRLAKLEDNQIKFFTDLYGSPPQVRLSILRPGRTKKHRLDHRLIAQSPTFRVDQYFGASPSFALDKAITVKPGYIVALTVPTWAPAFARDLSKSNWWRSSRRKGHCDNVSNHSEIETTRTAKTFGCTYHTARLLYSATYVQDPTPVKQTPAK
jgi:hypothetical protein